MKVKGVEIPQTAIDAATDRMQASSFTLDDIARLVWSWACDNGVSAARINEVSDRAADRIIQAQRKNGNIECGRGRVWRWVGERTQGDDR